MRNLAPRSLTFALMLLALAACSTDTPTAPERTPAPPPGSSPATAWNITVTVEPRDLTASNAQPATVTIRVRRASDGSLPQNGTTVVVSAGLGEFGEAGSGLQIATVALGGGAAQLLYFAGAILGQDTILAQLENSVGAGRVNIMEAAIPFIQSVSPTSGPQGGGTRIRISGTGFMEPLRVTVGTINASVDRVGEDSDGEFIRAFTGPVVDPDSFFTSPEGCDTNGDGINDGARYLPKTVDVVVTPAAGTALTLANAFTYNPSDRSCRDITPDPDKPRADFSFIKGGGGTLTVKFFNESTPATGLTLLWAFGDGEFATNPTPEHDYGATLGAGTYDVILRVENASGSDTKTRKVTVP